MANYFSKNYGNKGYAYQNLMLHPYITVSRMKSLEQVLTLSVHNYNYYSLRTHKMEFAKCVCMGSCDILALYISD